MTLTPYRPGEILRKAETLCLSLKTLIPAGAGRIKRFRKGDVLFRASEPARYLYLIQSGRVALLLDNEAGETVEAEDLGAGHVIGTEALFQLPYDVTAQSLCSTTVFVCAARDIRESLNDSPAVILKFLLDNLREKQVLRQRLLRDVTLSGLQRLAGHVLSEAEPGPEGAFLALPWGSKTCLARHLALRQETLSRLLVDLDRRGAIRILPDGVGIQDESKLREIAGPELESSISSPVS